jgi:hypothetical protein
MALIKTMTIDEFYTKEEAKRIHSVINNLSMTKVEFGKELENFNMVPENANQLFSRALNIPVEVIEERSGIFRNPEWFIHFEEFDSLNEWLFVVAIDHTTFDLYEHQSGAKSALDGYKFNYKNLFEWNHCVNYQLAPSQGIFFRPWLFHSFISNLIQVFRLKQKNDNTV